MACLILCVFATTAQAGDKYMYSFGGAGDAGENLFTNEFQNISTTAQRNGWQNQILFGRNPSESAKVQNNASSPVKEFSQKNFKDSLDQIVSDAQSGKIKSGDQVLIMIDSHGSPYLTSHSDGTVDKAHNVSCSDGDCSLGPLEQVIKTLESKGVKVALVDLSCYSGQSMNLASSKTCVVSATSANDVSRFFFSKNFIANMKSGTSLENVFLSARLAGDSVGRAEISTTAGQLATSTIQELGSESLQRVSAEDLASAHKETPCEKAESRNQMKKTLRQFNDIESKLYVHSYQNATAKYQKIYDQAQKLATQINSYSVHHLKTKMGTDYTWPELAAMNDNGLKEINPTAYDFKQQLKNNPDFQKLLKLQTDFNKQTNADVVRLGAISATGSSPLAKAAAQTLLAEKILYDKIYRDSQYLNKKDNPCANFIF